MTADLDRPYSVALSRLATEQGVEQEHAADDAAMARSLVHTIRAFGDIQAEAARLQREAVAAAREANVSWAGIGHALGISRQAAQQRFSMISESPASEAERLIGHVSRGDEMSALQAAGDQGWKPVQSRHGEHVVVWTDARWEVQRVSVLSLSRLPTEADGWSLATTRFPDCFYVRMVATTS